MTILRHVAPALLLSLSVVATAHAGPARDRLEAFTKGLDALQGEFVQQVYDAEGRLDETSKGSLALKAPRLFRWKYDAPFPQLIVADGDNVWIHDEDLEQVTVRKQSLEEAQSPLTVLTDLAQLDRDYTVTESGAKDGLEWLTLVPKAEEAPFRQALLGFAGSGVLGRMVLEDTLGQRNEISFRNWKVNPPLDAATFRFTPPDGVDVVGEPAVAAKVTPLGD
ncbi:MAG TPA: outer membrane lipoprotein chaperone LolA [Xanthomonadales bacterium]|nr:outer membrane lipoprotein chaperone LolA [Xanthomonadales bacterium]